MTLEQSEVLRLQIRSKNVLSSDETELFELTQLAGLKMDPSVFKIVLDLLKQNVAPMAILQMLKMMCDPNHQKATTEIPALMSTSLESMKSVRSSPTSHSQPHSRSSSQNREKFTRSTLKDAHY